MAEENSNGWWAPVWVGLINDPQHQARMGKAIWLYLHLQLYADRSTGKGLGIIKCQDIADKTGRDERTIRRNLKKLEDEKYITLTRAPYGFYFQITKWKPIKKVERPDISEQSETSGQEFPRVPKGGQSEKGKFPDFPSEDRIKVSDLKQDRLDKNVRSETGETGHFLYKDRTKVSNRPDTFVRSINRKYFKGLKRFKKTAVAEKDYIHQDIDYFFEYAGIVHQKFRDCKLFNAGEADRERIRGMLAKYSLRTLCIAWVWFLQSTDKYIVKTYSSRNIAVFGGQLRNFIEPAERKIMDIQSRQKKIVRSREPTVAVDPAQAENWGKCLREIEVLILPENYSTLIKPLVFGGVKQGMGKLVCPSRFYLDCVSENFGDLIETTMSTVFGEPVSPVFLQDTG